MILFVYGHHVAAYASINAWDFFEFEDESIHQKYNLTTYDAHCIYKKRNKSSNMLIASRLKSEGKNS